MVFMNIFRKKWRCSQNSARKLIFKKMAFFGSKLAEIDKK
jgi:hypothetical protein